MPQGLLVVTRCITEWSSFGVSCRLSAFRRTFGTGVVMLHVVFTTPSTKAVIVPRLLFAEYPGSSNVGEVLTSYRGAAERPDDGDELETMEGELKDAARPEESFLHRWASFLISLQP